MEFPVGFRKFYDTSKYENLVNSSDSTEGCSSEARLALLSEIRSNVIGACDTFLTPFGTRQGRYITVQNTLYEFSTIPLALRCC